jgi:hypothetical protein
MAAIAFCSRRRGDLALFLIWQNRSAFVGILRK